MFDADLYASTLYVLATLDPRLDSYFAIFDEFHGGENLALMNYLDAFSATNKMMAKATAAATHVLGKIETRSSS